MRLNNSVNLLYHFSTYLIGILISVGLNANIINESSTLVKTECGYPDVDRHTKTVDASRCFAGDLCCCNFDAFYFADFLLSQRKSVFTGRIEEVQELPDTMLVRRDVIATIVIEKVFGGNKINSLSKIHVRLSSDMFIWEETGQSRIVARQTLANDHESKVRAIVERRHKLKERNAKGDIDHNEYEEATIQLEAEREELGHLRWDWEGEIGVITIGTDGPVPNCNNGRFTTDRFGALEVGPTYLFALDQAINETDGVYLLSDELPWSIFWGHEMNDVVRALTFTIRCLNWPQIVYEPEDEYVAISICSDWARGANRPWSVKRRH